MTEAEELITTSVVVTKRLKACLEQWAAADDRSVSYILRDILKKECDRRAAHQQEQTGPKGQANG